MSDKFVKMMSTWFYIGYLPIAPGTFASAVAVLLVIVCAVNDVLYGFVSVAVIAAGFAVCGSMEKLLGKKDPGCIVIDEVAGIMVSFFLLPLYTPAVILTAFFLFRAFDMFKIYPANKFEEMGGPAGVMADDLVAGIYTNLVMQVAIRWAGVI